jgi:hypothetical protein
MNNTLTRPRANTHPWASWPIMLRLLGVLAVLLSGCGASPSSSSPHVSCTIQIAPGGVDVTQALVRCTVSDAPASDTSFTLHYALVDDNGKTLQPFDAPCQGTLAHGTGTCQQAYSVVAPKSPTDSQVSGKSLPSNTTLGPVTPTETPS